MVRWLVIMRATKMNLSYSARFLLMKCTYQLLSRVALPQYYMKSGPERELTSTVFDLQDWLKGTELLCENQNVHIVVGNCLAALVPSLKTKGSLICVKSDDHPTKS